MSYKDRMIGDKTFFDNRKHHPKHNYHHSDKRGRMVWCDCFPDPRILRDGKLHHFSNFWQKRVIFGRSKYNIRLPSER